MAQLSISRKFSLISLPGLCHWPSLCLNLNKAREKYKNGDFIIDARIGHQFTNMIKFGFVVNNLLNREYMTRPATMMSPRTFAFQFSLKI